MSAGNRNKTGKPTDYVRHYHLDGRSEIFCGQKNVGYSTNDVHDVDCKKCLRKLLDIAREAVHAPVQPEENTGMPRPFNNDL